MTPIKLWPLVSSALSWSWTIISTSLVKKTLLQFYTPYTNTRQMMVRTLTITSQQSGCFKISQITLASLHRKSSLLKHKARDCSSRLLKSGPCFSREFKNWAGTIVQSWEKQIYLLWRIFWWLMAPFSVRKYGELFLNPVFLRCLKAP